MKLFTIDGAYIKAFGKLKMSLSRLWFCETLAKLSLDNWSFEFYPSEANQKTSLFIETLLTS